MFRDVYISFDENEKKLQNYGVQNRLEQEEKDFVAMLPQNLKGKFYEISMLKTCYNIVRDTQLIKYTLKYVGEKFNLPALACSVSIVKNSSKNLNKLNLCKIDKQLAFANRKAI